MKKQVYSLLTIALLAGFSAMAQDTAPKAKEKTKHKEVTVNSTDTDGKKNITIEKSVNGKSEKMVIVVDGDKVTINGKPAEEFKGDKFFEDGDWDGDLNLHISPDVMAKGRTMFRNFNGSHSNKAMLGVSSEKDEKGAKVKEIVPESAADKAGLKAGDIITNVNGEKIVGDNDLVKLIGKYKPEETVDVTVLRDGKEKKLKAKLGKNDSPTAMNWSWNGDDNFKMPKVPMPPLAPDDVHAFNFNDDNFQGFSMRSDRPKFGFSIADNEDGDGVKITDIKTESNAEKAGLKKDDLVTEINGTTVKNTDELKKQLAESKDKTDISLKVLRNGSPQTISVKVPKKIKTAEL